jgi:hypothetical protein
VPGPLQDKFAEGIFATAKCEGSDFGLGVFCFEMEAHDHMGTPDKTRRSSIPRTTRRLEELLDFIDTGDFASTVQHGRKGPVTELREREDNPEET